MPLLGSQTSLESQFSLTFQGLRYSFVTLRTKEGIILTLSANSETKKLEQSSFAQLEPII